MSCKRRVSFISHRLHVIALNYTFTEFIKTQIRYVRVTKRVIYWVNKRKEEITKEENEIIRCEKTCKNCLINPLSFMLINNFAGRCNT